MFVRITEDLLNIALEILNSNTRYNILENGSKEAVLDALSHYQNADGGFGHALEPDAWNPDSSPIQTWFATEILREIGFTDNSHPIVTGILDYLESGKDFDGRVWHNIIKSNDDHPHAPWWDTGNMGVHDDYNPTACLAGFIIKYADKNSRIYKLGCRLAKEAVGAYMAQGLLDNMSTVLCYIRLMQYAGETGATGIFDADALRAKLIKQVETSITRDTDIWQTSYTCKPSQFIDGSWNITWKWTAWPEEWAVSKNWWKSCVIILNLLYLKGFGRI
jgi:hypothetical protein